MEYAAGPPSRWFVRLKSGGRIELWADGFSEQDGYYVFGVLVDASPEELQEVSVTSWPPLRPGCFQIVVAKIPEAEVSYIESAADVAARGHAKLMGEQLTTHAAKFRVDVPQLPKRSL